MNKQIVPITLSLSLFVVFSVITYGLIHLLNLSPLVTEKLTLNFIWGQFFLGIFIYLKTSIDYALFVGSLMEKNEGIKKRIAMNVGTQLGCFVGVTAILVLWVFFKEIRWLMCILLLVAGNVLIGLGDGSQEHFESLDPRLKRPLEIFFKLTRPVVKFFTFFMPHGEMKATTMSVKKLFFISGIIPFVLGADDLAGYMVLLAPINVFSLLVGIYFGDAIIDMALFYDPRLTIKIVKNKWVSFLGALFFIGLGLLSIYHAIHLYL